MAESLWISSAVVVRDILFFMTEGEGYPGTIRISTGEVRFLTGVPDEIIGCPSYEMQLFNKDGNVYIISNNGAFLYRYNLDEDSFESLYIADDYEKISTESCAEKWMYENAIFIITRSGYVVSWNFKNNKMNKEQILKEKLIWGTSNGRNVWLITEESFDLYLYDVESGSCELFSKDILKGFATKSKSWIPLHHVRIDGEKLYIHDAATVYIFDINKKEARVLFHADIEDNGSRLIITNQEIVIPPFSGNSFLFIDKHTGELIKKEIIPEDLAQKTGSVTGGVCEGDEMVYLPLTGSRDKFLGIDKENAVFTWFRISAELKGKSEIPRHLIKKDKVVNESKFMSLGDFINVVEKL